MSWTRTLPTALAVCVLLLTGSVGCGSGGTRDGGETRSPSPAGRVLDHTDDDGRHYREVAKKGAPEVGVEVQPDAHGGWDVRVKLARFRLSPSGTPPKAVAGRGVARLYVDSQQVADLRSPSYRIPAGYLPHGTHEVTVRLYADDATVWAVEGRPVEATADVTASEPSPAASGPASAPGAPSGSPSGSPSR
ncbi:MULTISPECIES: hypothetical protein [Streptomyces]|uniref:hypothetical protein n=1 Tax=Streptomyces TaxID=1883 RepID=UPI002119FF25|nr:hypothetical protein [Streptomyces hilarionis]MCQ9133665.1 hypothetical protein [Streptomyces hilarionis]